MEVTINQAKQKKNDIVYTPIPLAKKMIEMCEITPDMSVLDPCYGSGNFYNNFPECKKSFCEINMGKDFFDERSRYDLIIGNPPYSMLNKWIEHTITLTDKFCYLLGALNFQPNRFYNLEQKGYRITKMYVCCIDYFLGSSFVFIVERNKPGIVEFAINRYNCDVCGKRCNRGQPGYSFNECSPKPEKKRKTKGEVECIDNL
jgi:hypothetical protein